MRMLELEALLVCRGAMEGGIDDGGPSAKSRKVAI